MTDSDAVLAARARTGDRPAFEELVRRTSGLVYARLYVEAGDPHAAEDLAQETYLRAWRAVAALSDPALFRPWLLSIARAAFLDGHRRDARKKRTPPAPAAAPASETDAPEPLDSLERQETRRRALAALREMPDEYRLPLAMHYLDGADYDTISRRLGLTNGSLRGMLYRGLELLRSNLKQVDSLVKPSVENQA